MLDSAVTVTHAFMLFSIGYPWREVDDRTPAFQELKLYSLLMRGQTPGAGCAGAASRPQYFMMERTMREAVGSQISSQGNG